MRIRNTLTSLFALGLLTCTISNAAHAGQITVYSALENDEIATYLAAARRAMLDVQVNVLRLSMGDLADANADSASCSSHIRCFRTRRSRRTSAMA
ncbi:hypothetical protein [Paraburkholderia bannensis]|uniref:hypothetical protein n=1 Tax=Paraburkholderia bannensis TaxID=765414 RepID=UPI002AC330AA|nr:hypothetical protein [Paraburkholderia bannensis]